MDLEDCYRIYKQTAEGKGGIAVVRYGDNFFDLMENEEIPKSTSIVNYYPVKGGSESSVINRLRQKHPHAERIMVYSSEKDFVIN